jgi:hypothetical protein
MKIEVKSKPPKTIELPNDTPWHEALAIAIGECIRNEN